jgi:4'-phosphopantetheinyl transferase
MLREGPGKAAIAPGEILVWLMEVDAPPAAIVEDWRACLDVAELARADRFYFDADRVTYIAAHWLLRCALAETGGLPPAHWRFVEEKHGKPWIDPALGLPELRFNLSHSTGLVVCAVTVGAAIGIDVELISPQRVGLDIAGRYFSADEVALLRSSPPQKQQQTFFRLWTLKEALIKATGEGLHRALDSFSFSLDPTAVTFHPIDPEDADAWVFLERRPTARHVLALAIKQPSVRPVRLLISRVHVRERLRTVIDCM